MVDTIGNDLKQMQGSILKIGGLKMFTTLICTRKYNKEEYKFYLNEPSYEGERGVCGVKIAPYIHVETPENCFGYSDTVLLNGNNAYTLHRYLQPWILEKIEKKMIELMIKYGYCNSNLRTY